MQRSSTRPKTFEVVPQHKFVLNYRSADFSTKTVGAVGGLPPGIFPIQFADDPFYQGVYTLYVQIERMDGKRCSHEYVPPPPKE